MTDHPPTRKSSLEAARAFARFHELAFRQAIAEQNTEERGFDFSAEQFDAWAVADGFMTRAASGADDLERTGIVQKRFHLRYRLNRAARDGKGLDRAYSIEARAGRWRVVLSERFLVEQPAEIVAGIRGAFNQSERRVAQAKKMLAAQEHLTDTERMLCTVRLEMAEMYIFNGLQTVEMVVHQATSGVRPDLKRLRRAMAEFWQSEPTRRIGRSRRRRIRQAMTPHASRSVGA